MKNDLDFEIINKEKQYESDYKKVINEIKYFKKIAIFRHVKPDYDAIGSQLGMFYFIKDNFPDKDVIYIGEDHVTLTPRCFPYMMKIDDDWFNDEFLAIIVDTSTYDRVSDNRYIKATKTIKIDHHPNVNPYGEIQIIDDTISACGELIANFLIKQEEYKITTNCASYLFKAIVGDSNRFLNSDVNAHTFAVAEFLIHQGININQIYNQMYKEDISALDFAKWVLDNYHITKKGVAYYIIDKDQVDVLHLKAEQGKDCLYLFDHFDNIHIWVSITYDNDKNLYRVSLRSDNVSIENVATKYRGGGHAQASGAKLLSLDELPSMIKDLDDLL
ncbi:MAG TPA: hypothetical protein DDW20_06415 [Firmicutes bacterium]|nr:hypothetical protein [Bacillota bacterium]